jgi:uncharacterized membrane protein
MTVPITTIATGGGSGIVKPGRTIVRNPVEWQALWAAHAGPAAPAPDVDFARDMVVAVFAGERPSPGYEIAIGDVRHEGAALVVAVNQHAPRRGTVAAQVMVSPFHIARLPRHEGEVRFVDGAGSQPSGQPGTFATVTEPRARPVPPQALSSTGLDPNLAAALAYLAGPFSGLLILIVERANGYVRFHAWQSILVLGGLGVLSAATLILSFATLLVSPLLFTVMYRFSEIVAIAWLVAWIVLLVKAFSGARWEMPIAGPYAARLAARGVAAR